VSVDCVLFLYVVACLFHCLIGFVLLIMSSLACLLATMTPAATKPTNQPTNKQTNKQTVKRTAANNSGSSALLQQTSSEQDTLQHMSIQTTNEAESSTSRRASMERNRCIPLRGRVSC
jgi:hypothetical protein